MNAVVDNADETRRHYLLRLSSKLDDDYKPTDHILKRWAASIGDGTPDYDEVVLASKVTPLPDCVAIVVDQTVIRSEYRLITELWYRTPEPIDALARRLRIDETMVRPTWRASLRWFRVLFETSPLSDLRKLAHLDVRARMGFVAKGLDARAGE